MRATKLNHKIKKMPYVERLKKPKLHIVKYRRLRGDMIETFKVVHEFFVSSLPSSLNFHTCARGNCFKLVKSRVL
jgi:hypothetical protein